MWKHARPGDLKSIGSDIAPRPMCMGAYGHDVYGHATHTHTHACIRKLMHCLIRHEASRLEVQKPAAPGALHETHTHISLKPPSNLATPYPCIGWASEPHIPCMHGSSCEAHPCIRFYVCRRPASKKVFSRSMDMQLHPAYRYIYL